MPLPAQIRSEFDGISEIDGKDGKLGMDREPQPASPIISNAVGKAFTRASQTQEAQL